MSTVTSGLVPSREFPSTPRLLIRASAGTGKTFQLSNRYLSLARRSSPDEILAVTFTRKAAGEILERILTRIAEAVLNDNKREQLSSFLGGSEFTAEEAEGLLRSFVRQLHRMKVATLDGLFSRLATSIPFEIGLPPNWSIADEQANASLLMRSVDDVLRTSPEATIHRLIHMLAKGNIPRSVTSLLHGAVRTYYSVYRMTEAEAWNRIHPGSLLPAAELEACQILIADFDLGANKQMAKGREGDLVRARESKWEEFLEGGLAKAILVGGGKYYKKDIPEGLVDLYRPLIAHARALLLTIWRDQIAALYELLREFDRARTSIQADSGELGFDDVAFALSRRMSQVDARTLVHRLDADISHLLLDEFQDTSLLQWDVLWPFVQGLDDKQGSSFFCVGDVKQAIYGWRGGVASLFDKVQRDVRDLCEGALVESRRSSPAVIGTVNKVFENLLLHPNLGEDLSPVVERWGKAFPHHETALQDSPGYVVLQTADGLPQDAADGRRLCCGKAADLVAELMTRRPDLTIGVLSRKNEIVGQMIHQLNERGLQASEEGGVRLTTSAAVQLVQSLLQFADHPGDSASCFHVAHSPLASRYRIRPGMTAEAAHKSAARIREELVTEGYEATLERWVELLRPVSTKRDWSRLRRLCVLAVACDQQGSLRPSEFAQRIEDERVEETSASSIRVMTIHKSKGLEFDVVILPDLDFELSPTPDIDVASPQPAERPDLVLTHRNDTLSSLLPPDLYRAVDQQRESNVHEALCCLYVALTRAAHSMFMVIAPQGARKDGTTTYQKTAAGLLRATLSTRPDIPASVILGEVGDPDWLSKLPPLERPAEATDATTDAIDAHSAVDAEERAVVVGDIVWTPRSEGRTRGRETVSPSHSKQQKRTIPASRLLSTEVREGSLRGTLWHLWCQELHWLDDSQFNQQHLLAVGRPHIASEQALQLECAEFMKALQNDAIRNLFLRDQVMASRPDLVSFDRVTCVNEQRFTMLEEGHCVSGAIDRLVLYYAGDKVIGADVIDFKTDQAGEKASLRAGYQDQIRLYGAAIARSRDLDPAHVRCQLVWLNTGVVENVSAKA